MKKNIFLILISILVLSSCDDLWDPAPENLKSLDQMYLDSRYALGFITNAYRTIPGYYDNSEYATDDAVTNQKDNSYLKIATGSWTANNNPLNQWANSYSTIQNINLFLENAEKVKWDSDSIVAKLFLTRTMGEAYGLRALFLYHALRAHAGYTEDGQLMGVPILTKFLVPTSDFNIPRATFEECVQQIYQDLDSAEKRLPLVYEDVTTVPAKFQSITTTASVYNRVMGQYARQLFNGLITRAVRAQVSLLAASPAYQHTSNTTTWEKAADAAAMVLDYKNGVAGLAANGVTYYANTTEIDALADGKNPAEMIWRQNISTNNSDMESQNFPPSLFGSGYMNPTQNLVDAFPMANGYPINNSLSQFNPANPYVGRDPRLAKYIIYNGSTAGVSNTVIYTGSASTTDDGIGIKTTSTRTGYYMKKRLRMDVNRNPSSIVGKTHYNPRIRYTEIFLAYAEAANEAWGPTGTGTHAYSAYDVIKAIRKRAGVGTTNGDPYLEECKLDQAKMRDLIRTERRLELCFESFRFWDLRRWKLNLNETVGGIDINGTTISPIAVVEERKFEDYMYYGPIPYSEVLKYNKLIQNKGWK